MSRSVLLAALLAAASVHAQAPPPASVLYALAPSADAAPLHAAVSPGDVTVGSFVGSASAGALAGGLALLVVSPLGLVDAFDEAALVAYPAAAIFGAQLAAGVHALDGAQVGFVLGGIGGAVPGALLARDAGRDGRSRTLGVLVFLAGAPVGAVTGGVVVPQLIDGPRGPVPGARLRVAL